MILIQVQLATVSIISFVVAMVSVPPAVLGFILGVHDYAAVDELKIPACLTAAAEICVTLTQLAGVFWPYNLLQIAANVISVLLLAGSGMYFLCVRIEYIRETELYGFNTSIERAFICLWVVSLAVCMALIFFSIGAVVVATFGPEKYGKEVLEAGGLTPESQSSSGWIDSHKFFFSKKPSFGHSIHSLGSPVNIPTVPTLTQQPDGLSPRLSWPSSIGSIRVSDSLGSLQSAMQQPGTVPGNVTPPTQAFHHAAFPPVHAQGSKIHQIPSDEPKSPSIKTPKSPLKIHLTKSSFSLKRSPSKASQHTHTRAQHGKVSPRNSQMTLAASEPVPLGIPLGITTGHDPGTQRNWVMIPNENSAESRSVSGSSQLTGRVFPAAEYNRKINAAGFQRDEPVPVQVQVMPSRQSLSQYDLERVHRQSRFQS